MNYRIYTYAERPDLTEQRQRVMGAAWPEFMFHDAIADVYWGQLSEIFPDFQFTLCDESDRVLAVGNSIPVIWDGRRESLPETGWDAVLEGGFRDRESGRAPDTLSALSVAIDPASQGKGVSTRMVAEMRAIAARHGLRTLIAPVRPNWKSRYPLIPMERYAWWKIADGAPFDPWLRVHWRCGADLLRVAPRSMTIPGTIAEWEEWTGLPIPESGQYIIPGALEPVSMDKEKDQGIYIEPNVWMKHTVEEG